MQGKGLAVSWQVMVLCRIRLAASGSIEDLPGVNLYQPST
jgi:hypothetical protein